MSVPSRAKRAMFAAGVLALACAAGRAAKPPANFFGNAGFEMGQSFWHMDTGEGTVARFAADATDAAEGRHSALVTIEKIGKWGVQFGQKIECGRKGRTYTFAAMVKPVGGPVRLGLEVERRAKPWDRAGRSAARRVGPGQWTELHVTFKVAKDFPQGWFAYVSCVQPACRFRVDAARLYEGDYVPIETAARQAEAVAGVRLFDTLAASAAPLDGQALRKRAGWRPVPAGRTKHPFQGDAVFLNDRLAVAVRRKGGGAELYSMDSPGPRLRGRLIAEGTASAGAKGRVRIVENGPAGVAVEAGPASSGGLVLRLGMGQVFVETSARGGVEALRVEAPCRFVVLPDFFADDIVADAAELPVAEAELPGENFLLHMLGEGEAILMTVAKSGGQDVGLTLAGEGAERLVRTSRTRYGKGGKIWVAVLAGDGIWHRRDVARSDAGKVLPLKWRRPWPGQWRVDWRRDTGLTDSWEMIARMPGGKFTRHGWFGSPQTIPANRSRWTTVLGRFRYPCWIDHDGRGYLQPLAKPIRFAGPVLVYPIHRARKTPLEAFTVVDVVRATLGVGPCEYILDVEGQKAQYRGRATCSNRGTLDAIYKSRQQRRKRAEIETSLTEVMQFVRHIRGRIEAYRAFGRETLAWLDRQKRARPELAGKLEELAKLTRAIEQRVAARRGKIKTPDQAAAMVETFRRTMLDYEGRDAFERCRKFTAAMVEIGGNQDELVGECRWAVKVLRQRAALTAALDPRLGETAREIRARTRKILRNPASHEGARH